MTRARLDMAVDLAWLHERVPGGSPAQLVDFALQHAVNYVPAPSPLNQRPDDKAWFDESKARPFSSWRRWSPNWRRSATDGSES